MSSKRPRHHKESCVKNKLNKPVVKRILLTGVFGPFGVDDEYGRKENIMELFHNQVTKGQGIGSFRLHHLSFGLYFIAENIDADVTVLDFPSKKRFIKELKNEYDAVGISFITPNFVKAQEMARLIRLHSPGTEIILGGHGAAIEGVETLIDCDHVVKGEGISWMRRYLGQDPHAPIHHPSLPASTWQRIYGIPIPGVPSNLLVPGVGCVNGCNFCSTSHFFGKTYSPFISTGQELFETARRIADERGTDVFFVMDENFLKDKTRALELIDEMERHERFFQFYLFSSAETIVDIGIENLVRLGVQFLWVGLESKNKHSSYEKNHGIDPMELIRELRDHGISVLASGILGLEHHTPENIQEEIDFMIGVEADMVQFMIYTALPVTALYKKNKRIGLLREDLPYEEWHGQKWINWRHPAFGENELEHHLNNAFKREFEINSSSMYRRVETLYRGYKKLASWKNATRNIQVRKRQFEACLREYSLMLSVIERYPANQLEKRRAQKLSREIRTEIGPCTAKEKVLQLSANILASIWNVRLKTLGDTHQPSTVVTHYKASDQTRDKQRETGRRTGEYTSRESSPTNRAAAAFVATRVLKNANPSAS